MFENINCSQDNTLQSGIFNLIMAQITELDFYMLP